MSPELRSVAVGLQVDSENTWKRDNFYSVFGFEAGLGGFSKIVRGKRYDFRPVVAAEDFVRVLEVQRLAWRWSETDLAPTHILALMADTGGGVFGAYNDNGEMIAFAAGFGGGTDVVTGKPSIISSMLAVAGDQYRSGGVGKELKIIQAFYAFENGYQVMKWFYDPERGENATLNIRKLGARAEEFAINKYGEMRSDLYGPVPTDRFRAVWRFTDPKVLDRLIGVSEPPTLESVVGTEIVTSEYMPDNDKILVQISSDIDSEPDEDKTKRRFRLRTVLSHYFLDREYVATEFITGKDNIGNRVNYYLLEPKAHWLSHGQKEVA